MKTRNYIALIVALLISSLGLIGIVNAAPGGNPGPPDSDGGSAPVDYGDLVILLRDEDGVPILTPDGVEGPNTGLCQQPLAFNVSDELDTLCPTSCQDGGVVNVDQSTCAIVAGCAGCVKEIEFGRINEARSPASVFESQLEDAIVTLATADCLTLDPAGRMVASTVDNSTGETLTKTIDSPLQNLAIYRELIMKGDLGVPLPQEADVLDTAARGLGAASDKSGGINVDMVAYLNRVMGLTDEATTTILDPKICITMRKEVQGVVQPVEECFLDYGLYAYNRGDNFLALPAPPYIPEGAGTAGWFEYLAVYDEQVPTFWIVEGPIVEAVFPDGLGSYVAYDDGNIDAFAQAADDARAVIDFMHSNPIPEGYETALVCEAAGDIFYDLSISEQSGLQVPKNYVSGTEREFTVTVANAGPDAANATVTVTATADSVLVGEWPFQISALLPGQSNSFTEYFAISTNADSIEWKAEVVAAPPGSDPNPLNNTREVVSSVRASGGGGGH